jgi:hypothetical protein
MITVILRNLRTVHTEIESIKHQLAALGVLRPKIGAVRPVVETAAGTVVAETAAVDEEQSVEMDAEAEDTLAV